MAASIPENIEKLSNDIAKTQQKFAREHNSVQLLAVSKKQTANAIRQAFESGLTKFGESYLQEALEKQQHLTDLPLQWHFIGPIQSNKTKSIAENFSWVHSVDRLKIADRLNMHRPDHLPPLNILLQVNLDGEASKSGLSTKELPDLAKQISLMPNLKLTGLMTIPSPSTDFEEQRHNFRLLNRLKDKLIGLGYSTCTELSMGMSQDYQAAIAEGATIIRIGTGVFGSRK